MQGDTDWWIFYFLKHEVSAKGLHTLLDFAATLALINILEHFCPAITTAAP